MYIKILKLGKIIIFLIKKQLKKENYFLYRYNIK